MEEQIRIVLADPGEDYRNTLCQLAQSQEDITVVGETGDGIALLELIHGHRPDVVVMEAALTGIDGIEVLEGLDALGLEMRPQIIVLSGFLSGHMIEIMGEKGADYCIAKPCAPGKLFQRIRQLGGKKAETSPFTPVSIEMKITGIIQEVGLPAHVKGYQYTRYAILSAVQDPTVLDGITKVLYPQVAKQYHTTASRVERAIRHSIEFAWKKGNPEGIERYFGSGASQWKKKPTNSQFIALIADKITLLNKAQEESAQ